MHDYAKNCIDGVFDDPTWVARIHAADEDTKENKTDWSDPAQWYKANPSLGKLPNFNIEYFHNKMRELKQWPSRINSFKRLHLNMWVGSEVAWMEDHKWLACNFGKIDPERLYGRECYGGFDLAQKRDLCAYSLLFPPIPGDPKWHWLVWQWCPKETIEGRERKEHTHYSVWENDGHIITTDGDVTDYEFITKFILETAEKYDIKDIGYDKYKAAQIAIQLQNAGLTLSAVPQTPGHMTIPVDDLEYKVLKGEINHGGNPVLRYQSNNMKLRENASGNRMPDKEKSKSKIDGMVSGLIALHRAIQAEIDNNSEGADHYENNPVINFSKKTN